MQRRLTLEVLEGALAIAGSSPWAAASTNVTAGMTPLCLSIGRVCAKGREPSPAGVLPQHIAQGCDVFAQTNPSEVETVVVAAAVSVALRTSTAAGHTYSHCSGVYRSLQGDYSHSRLTRRR